MHHPSPAIVAQSAVRRLPRLALLLFCVAFVLPGFIARQPWKNADMSAFGVMWTLAQGQADWLHPSLLGQTPEVDALLPYWLGALAMQLAPSWLAADFAARLPFMALSALTLLACWYAVYYLARSPHAQPVAFAFGGEARPSDYARAIADGGLLALVASLGLYQLAHETTPALAQICCCALTLFGLAVQPIHPRWGMLALPLGLLGLSLSGAPAMAAIWGAGASLLCLLETRSGLEPHDARPARAATALLATAASAGLASALGLWHWRIEWPASWPALGHEWRSLGRLWLWFTWPTWPLALWTLWRWRRQLRSRHVALPLWFALVAVSTTLITSSADRSLLLALPALAALAAFALPTLRRSMAAWIDWFTLLFFSSGALIIWLVWLAMQTGYPPQVSANVTRLAPGFVPSFSLGAFIVALLASSAWCWLVHWRVGRHRAALWKSLVLPASGAALCWLLLMSLWLPLLDFARSYAPLVERVARQIAPATPCTAYYGLSPAQLAAFSFHARLQLQPVAAQAQCPWLIVDADMAPSLRLHTRMDQWKWHSTWRRPSDNNEDVQLYQRRLPAP